jgi:glutamate decarboxylase
LSGHIEAMPEFRLISRGDELPVFAFTTTDHVSAWDVFALSRALRERGWQVPAYTFPADREDLSVLRIVCRNGFSQDLAGILLDDVRAAVVELNTDARSGTASGPAGFRH